jgi:hypothetical protein
MSFDTPSSKSQRCVFSSGEPIAVLNVRFLDSTSRAFSDTALGWLLNVLPRARRLTAVSAYYDGAVLDWLEEPIEALIRRGGAARIVVGSNRGVTRAEDVERLLRVLRPGMPQSRLAVEYYEDALFHPKVYIAELARGARALIGSANMTASGSVLNVEMGVELSTNRSPSREPPLASMLAALETRPAAVAVNSAADITRLVGLGVLGRGTLPQAPRPGPGTAGQARRRRAAGLPVAGGIQGVPAPTRRQRPPAPPRRRRRPGVPRPPAVTRRLIGLRFAANDLKSTGTREISVSRSIRDWASSIVGRPIAHGDDTLFHVAMYARLLATPARVFDTPEPVRIWATSPPTHFDVRQVLGTSLKDEIDYEAVAQTGAPVQPGAIGVFELPANPQRDPVRLTVVTAMDAMFPTLDAQLTRTRTGHKPEFALATIAGWPRWPF